MVITGWSAISPFGYGGRAFTAGLRAGRPAYRVPEFDITQRLGGKGTGSMDRSSALAISTAGQLLDGITTDPRTGVVLGTTSGSTGTQFEFTRASLVRRKPYFVNPAVMPFALMNSAASQCAIWHGLIGPNSTVANGRMSALVALRYANRLLATGRASGVVCGAVEEYSDDRALLERREVPLGEGCAMVFCEPAGPGTEVVAVETRLAVAGSPRSALVECLRGVLAAGGVEPGAVSAIAVSSADPVLLEMESAAVDEVFGRHPELIDPAALIGDTGAATGMFQVAALLTGPARWAVATCIDRDAMVGCALFRLLGKDAAGE
jgi:3-oxoacyl-[acyl-carrier-protein] synthase II